MLSYELLRVQAGLAEGGRGLGRDPGALRLVWARGQGALGVRHSGGKRVKRTQVAEV